MTQGTARPVDADRPWMGTPGWVAIGGLYSVAISAVVMAVTGWRAIDVSGRRLNEERGQQRRFQREMVGAIEELADKTGILTSADFCPVRFRLRMHGNHIYSIPARPISAELVQLAVEEQNLPLLATSTPAGLIDFGLVPPGRYRLHLQTSDGMRMDHEFDVLPGVPVDRVVICPFGPQIGHTLAVTIRYPERLCATGLVAICVFEPRSFVHDQWVWRSPSEIAAKTFLTGNLGRALTPGEVESLSRIMDVPDSPNGNLHLSDDVGFSYRYWQLSRATFALIGEVGVAELGTVIFGEDEAVVTRGAVEPAIRVAAAPPQIEVFPEERNLTLALPDEVNDFLVDQVNRVRQERAADPSTPSIRHPSESDHENSPTPMTR